MNICEEDGGCPDISNGQKWKKERIGRIKEHCWVSGPGITEYI